MFFLGCALLPNNDAKLLISGDARKTIIYDLETEESIMIGFSAFDHYCGIIVNLAGRLFMFGGDNNNRVIEEFILAENKWVVFGPQHTVAIKLMSSISVPVAWFSWLPEKCIAM